MKETCQSEAVSDKLEHLSREQNLIQTLKRCPDPAGQTQTQSQLFFTYCPQALRHQMLSFSTSLSPDEQGGEPLESSGAAGPKYSLLKKTTAIIELQYSDELQKHLVFNLMRTLRAQTE